MNVKLKRIYDDAETSDGVRILVDRLWPRGISKAKARVDQWLKELAPSTELRKWFAHDPKKWPAFQKKYRAELKNNPLVFELQHLAGKQSLTLVYAARDTVHNAAVVLKEVLEEGA